MDAASGSRRSLNVSLAYENASSAPWACIACAMPQAIERSVATPTIRARLPDNIPIVLNVLGARLDECDQSLPRLESMHTGHSIPFRQIGHGDLQQSRDAVHRVAAANHIRH